MDIERELIMSIKQADGSEITEAEKDDYTGPYFDTLVPDCEYNFYLPDGYKAKVDGTTPDYQLHFKI